MMGRLRRAFVRGRRRLARLRRRRRLVDHLWRAAARYDEQDGSRLAAAITYYGFFAVFALGVLGFSVLGAALADNKTAESAAELYLKQNLPIRDVESLAEASRGIGVVWLVGLTFAGIWWVESLRSSQRAIWRVKQHPGNLVVRYLIDLGVLAGLGLLLAASLSISLGLRDILLGFAGDRAQPLARHALDWSSALFAAMVDLVLAAALLAGVPRLRISPRRLLPSALLMVVGLALLKTGGRWYVGQITQNPAYQLAAGTIGLLIFMYLFNQLTLFAAALAATSEHGTVRDLAAGPPPRRRRRVTTDATGTAGGTTGPEEVSAGCPGGP